MTANKQKYEQAGNVDSNQALNNFKLLANSLKESTAILAHALLTQNPMEFSSTCASKTFSSATTFSLHNRISRMKSHLTKIQNTKSFQAIEIQQNIKMCLGYVTGLLNKILAVIDTNGNQGRNKA